VFREAAVPFVKKFIQLPDVWDTPQDQAQVVSLGELLLDLCSRTPVGTQVPDLRVSGVLRRKPGLFVSGNRSGEFALRKLKGSPAYVVFYSAQCSSCKDMLAAVERLVQENRRARVLLVDMDGVMTDAPEQGHLLLDTFDLSALPMVLELDKKGVVQRRYVDLTAEKSH
jgi:thiol-disulfide isomerase/thioredoxin